MSQRDVTLELAQFLDSREGRALGGLKRAEVRRVVEAFLEACYAGAGVPPRELDGEGLRGVLLEGLPARLQLKDPLAPELERILEAYLEHLHRSQVVTAAFEQKLALAHNAASLRELVQSGRNTRRAVPQKQAPVVHRAEKTGRNEPCFCGSGKKFKKCHGAAGQP